MFVSLMSLLLFIWIHRKYSFLINYSNNTFFFFCTFSENYYKNNKNNTNNNKTIKKGSFLIQRYYK